MKSVENNLSLPEMEDQVLSYWRENEIFLRSMDPQASNSLSGPAKQEKRSSYVFYDGPPFATGLPHYGHLLAGTIKDVIGRYFTMKGFHVDRRFGWDCHGVPVEFEIQKKLNLYGAKAIGEFGIDKFNEECRSIVQRYTKEWESFVERSGRWVDFDRQYRTMDLQYMESIWWALKSLWDRGLIYEGFKCVPYSSGMNTPLSNFEANLNYKDVQDPAVTIAVLLKGNPLAALGVEFSEVSELKTKVYIWTTTPWTLPSNMALAVGEEISYSVVLLPEKEVVIMAAERLAEYFPELDSELDVEDLDADKTPRIIGEVKGKSLLGLEYEPIFPYFADQGEGAAFRIYSGDFVTSDSGTGVVHLASFGEDDLGVFLENDIPVVDPVDDDACFKDEVSDFAGLYVKDADSKIISYLKNSGQLAAHKTIEHSYPFCWRTDTPLIYKSISSWFVKVEDIRDLLVQSNSQIEWVPGHIKEGRFGNWLENARDWAISRNRYWGTPLPIWRCSGDKGTAANEACSEMKCIGSVEELERLSGASISDLHSHFVDSLTFPCPKCGSEMKRVKEVLDCWFESGAMPYAQAHYPFENKEEFEDCFPADFIAEGLDQTRGWFYTLLVLSTALFGRPAFRNVIVNGIVLAEDGRKMSKSLQNYPPPDKVMNKFGADALRLYLLSSAATRAEELRFSEEGVKQTVRQTLLPLWNAYNFFVTYALVDEWTPADIPEEPSPNTLDRWILSRVGSLVRGVDKALGSYHLYSAAQPILEFVDQLTNWYIRLNRRRFWAGNSEAQRIDKFHAYATLHQVLLTFVRVLAPIAPFMSEEIFLNLSGDVESIDRESVHLCPFPKEEELEDFRIDEALEQTMVMFEEVILLGRTLRNDHGVKLRQPLSKLTIVYPDSEQLERLKIVDQYIRDELNIKQVNYVAEEEEFVTLSARLNTKLLGRTLGPKLGRDKMKQLHEKVRSMSTNEIRGLEKGAVLEFEGEELSKRDIIIDRKPKEGIRAAGSNGQITIVLDTALTRELRLEGAARDFINRVQRLRKEFGFDVSDRILVKYMTASNRLSLALNDHKEYVMSEVLAVDMEEISNEAEINLKGSSVNLPSPQEIEGETIIIALSRMQG